MRECVILINFMVIASYHHELKSVSKKVKIFLKKNKPLLSQFILLSVLFYQQNQQNDDDGNKES
jgi:hypothetical protein